VIPLRGTQLIKPPALRPAKTEHGGHRGYFVPSVLRPEKHSAAPRSQPKANFKLQIQDGSFRHREKSSRGEKKSIVSATEAAENFGSDNGNVGRRGGPDAAGGRWS